MSKSIVTYTLQNNIAVITMDDGKANACSHELIDQMNNVLDELQSEKKAAALVITGREDKFSAGYDLKEIGKGPAATKALASKGAKMALRLYSFPLPTVLACNGHAVAMGAVLLFTGDFRIGAEGPFKIGLNEVAIGMVLPHFAQELARDRLNPVFLNRSVVNAEIFTPETAVTAGFLDKICSAEQLQDDALAAAQQLSGLQQTAHYSVKLRIRKNTIKQIEDNLESDLFLITGA